MLRPLSPLLSAPARTSLPDALARAAEMAGAVPGAYADAPCRFVPVPPELGPTAADGARWVLVVSRPASEAGQRSHLRERSLTAAQRYMLSLACDDVDAAWHEAVPAAEALGAAGVDVGGGTPLGMIRCAPSA